MSGYCLLYLTLYIMLFMHGGDKVAEVKLVQ